MANGRSLTTEEAFAEVVADSMEAMMVRGDLGWFMNQVQKKDHRLWQKMGSWFKDLARKLETAINAYADYTPDSPEGRMVVQMEGALAELQKAFAEGLSDASRNYQAAEGQKNTTREGGINEAKNELYSERNDIVDVNGKEYDSVIMLDKPVPKRVLSDQRAFSKFLAGNLFNKRISVLDKNGDVEILEFAGEKERVSKGGKPRLVRGELTRATGDIRKVIIVNLEEVAKHSSYDPVFSSNDHSHGWLDEHGWESRKTFVTDGHMIYEAYLKIGKTADGRNVLYALNCNIKNGIAVDKSATSKRAAVRTSNADGKMVTSKPPKVKRNSDRDPTAAATMAELEKQNEKLREDIGSLKKLLAIQKGGIDVTDTMLYTAADYLKRISGVTDSKKHPAKTSELVKLLSNAYAYLSGGEGITWEGFREAAQPAVQWLREHNPRSRERSEYVKAVLLEIRGTRIQLTEEEMAKMSYR